MNKKKVFCYFKNCCKLKRKVLAGLNKCKKVTGMIG